MSFTVFGICLVLGAGAIAIWISVRFPKLMPTGVKALLIHMGLALVLARLVPFGIDVPISGSDAVQLVAGIFAVALPVLVYTLLIAIWLLRLAQNAMSGMLR